MTDSPLIVAAAIFAGPRLLAAQRSYPDYVRGKWELPGGKVNVGEAPLAALHREIREELECSITSLTEVRSPTGNSWPLMDELRMRVWLAEISGPGPVLTSTHLAFRWVTATEWRTLDWLSPNIPIVAAVFAQAAQAPRSGDDTMA